MRRIVATLALAATAAACGLNDAMTAHTDVAARAAGLELSVDEAATLIAPVGGLPADRRVAEFISNLWVDYVLLAKAVQEDSTLSQVELDTYLRPLVEQQVLGELSDKVIQVDTAISDDELRREFEQSAQGVQVRVRHILLRQDAQTPQPVRDSLRRLAEQLRDRARSGEDFAALAREHSQDATAANGGDTGFFERGDMVPAFDSAAFSLDVGDVSDVVLTPAGLHILKVEERRTPDFETNRESFRRELLDRRFAEARENYVTQLFDPLGIEVEEGAAQILRDLASNPDMQLSGRAAARTVVRYEGGELEAGEVRSVLSNVATPERTQLASQPDDALTLLAQNMAEREILLAEAASQGIEVSEATQDSMRMMLRENLVQTARGLGLDGIEPQEGETVDQAIERNVNRLLRDVLDQNAGPLTLGAISTELRELYDGEVFDPAYDQVAQRIEAIRAARPTPPMPQMPPMPPPDSGAAAAGS